MIYKQTKKVVVKSLKKLNLNCNVNRDNSNE